MQKPCETPAVAYFSMEIGIDPNVPTYSGGLGVLAGDTLRSAADIGLPLVGITLLHRCGYFFQKLDAEGNQTEIAVKWPVNDYLELLEPTVEVALEGRKIKIRAWRFMQNGRRGYKLPIYFLDTDFEGNSADDRRLTDTLYGGDDRYRLMQEAVLGVGGVRILRALNHTEIARFHLNEGHAALLTLALFEEILADAKAVTQTAIDRVRDVCIFTTHTPVPAAHDKFPIELSQKILGEKYSGWLRQLGQESVLNTTELALRLSRFINGVAMKHGQISRNLFPNYPIHSITNGVHTATWTSAPFQKLFDKHLADWRNDPMSLRYAIAIPKDEVRSAHDEAKHTLIEYVNRETNSGFDRDVFTLGFARRATSYKRALLIFQNTSRLRELTEKHGAIQIVFAGKAHPEDIEGKEIIKEIFRRSKNAEAKISVAYLANYDMEMAKMLCAGVDVWLNTPLPPLEASGTSGMKAAINGVPSLSILDGWWIEGCIDGVTGWAITDGIADGKSERASLDARDAESLYRRLDEDVLPCFYTHCEKFWEISRNAISINGSFFSSHRMLGEYLVEAYEVLGLALTTNA